MLSTFARRLLDLSRRLWVRVLLVASLGVLAILAVKATSVLVWEGAAEVIGAEALNRLLDIIARSMLAVTTFSLAVMVSVRQSATAQFTPRVHQTLLQDTTTQTVLATFIGTWIYALTAIVLLSTPYFGEREIVALYLTTLVVLVLIVVVLARWIFHLQTVGSFIYAVARLEEEAVAAMRSRPTLFARRIDGSAPDAPFEQLAPETGYVQALYEADLQQAAEKAGGQAVVLVLPGDFVSEGDVVARTTVRNAGLSEALRAGIRLGPFRTAEQDPLYGVIRLSEIASKALSPGINDPGTAVDVIGHIARVLRQWEEADGADARLDRIWLRVIDPEALVVESFGPIARDGAKFVEVQVALQERLAGLARHAAPSIAEAAREMGRRAYARAVEGLDFPADRARIEAAAAWVRG